MENTLELIKSLNINDEYVVVACSGGPDSMFLLNLLNKLGIKCVCAHVNHKVRISSDDEYKFLETFCNNNGIIFEGTELKEKYETNFEFHARNFRYNYFESIIKKYNAKYLFTAHHGDDLMETILMRLTRGSSLKGYRGFDYMVDKGTYKIVRPLVYLSKAEIEEQNRIDALEYVIDESNYEDTYTRNRYRHHVLPFLKQEDELVHLKFLYFNKTLKNAYDYVLSQVDKTFDKVYVNNYLIIDEFNKLDDYIKIETISKIFRIWYVNNLYLINENHVNNLITFISSSNNNTLELPDNLYVVKEYNKVLFTRNIATNEYKYTLEDKIELNDFIIKKIDNTDSNSNDYIRLNSKDIKLPLIVRTRIDGDKMNVKNMNGTKKINDIFIDMKVPKLKRNSYPIVTDSNNVIVWIPGLKKSNFDIPKDGEYDIILKYEKKEGMF